MRRYASGMAVGTLCVCGAVAAQTLDPSLLKTMSWRSIGPYRGGRVTAVAGLPAQPFVYYMGATGGGVWKTINAGITWLPISDRYFKTGSVGAIAVAESDPNVVYVGMGEACLRANISHGDGVYKSVDAGKSWTHIGLGDTRHIGRLRIDPRDPNVIYVAAVGHAFGPNAERGVFRSRDGGKTWQKVLFINDRTGAVDIDMDPRDSRVLYATTWQVLRAPWGITSTGPGSGIYKSIDGGDNWVQLANGLPTGDKGKIGIAISPVDSKRVWATVESEKGGGIYRSDDAGKSWRLLNDHFEVRGRQYYYGHIFADPMQLDTVYTFSSKGFFKSTDGGKTYVTLQSPHGDYHDLWIDPHNNLRMINGNDGGATVTFDGGKSWSTLDNQPTGQFYEAITDSSFPYRIYGSQQDNTTVAIPSRTEGGGIGNADWHPVGGGESGYLAPDPKNPEVTYGGSYFGAMTRYDHRTGELRNISIWPDYPGGRVAAEVKYRFQWTYPLVISPLAPDTIYAGAQVVFRSINQGQSWDVISPDLTRNDKTRERGGRLEEYYSTIFAIAPSGVSKDVIWAGSDDGLVHLTTDGGQHWKNVTPRGLPEWSRVNIIEPSPFNAATAYLAINRYQLDDFKPYFYKTSDSGQTWKLITRGIPEDTFARTIREDPARKGLLYAGTETGVYVSWDDGENWQPLQMNLPVTPVTGLAIKDNDLIASTQGRSFWILDDLTPLQQMSPAVINSDVHLFRPRGVYRPSRRGSRPGAPGMGQNPPSGLVATYYFRQKPAGPITLEFEESDGRPIKAFAKVSMDAGMNRFEWDLRYPDAHPLDSATHLAGGSLRGPVAAPGTYLVKLTANGVSQIQSFEVLKDPRLPTSAEEYRKQFALLIGVRDKLSATHDAVNQIDHLQAELKAGNSAAEQTAVAALDALARELAEPGFTGFDDQMLVFPLKLNNRIAALQGYVEGGYGPTDQDYKVYNELSAALEDILSRLKHVLDREVPAARKNAKGAAQ